MEDVWVLDRRALYLYAEKSHAEVGVVHPTLDTPLCEILAAWKRLLDQLDDEFDSVIEDFLSMLECDKSPIAPSFDMEYLQQKQGIKIRCLGEIVK